MKVLLIIIYGGLFMSEDNINMPSGEPEEEMSVELELEDGTLVNCAVITILDVAEKSYIVLLPLNENGQNEDGEVWFYGYTENEEDPNEEPELRFIEDDEEYEMVADAFDEYLDSCEFDELIDPEDE
jgi:uncharacterized protein YrzB (UPF0473 family)